MTKNVNSVFYKTLKAFSLLRQNKTLDCMELCYEVKSSRPSDPVIAKYLIIIYNEMGQYNETTALLESVISVSPDNEELCEELFYSYVRENKLLKQQN